MQYTTDFKDGESPVIGSRSPSIGQHLTQLDVSIAEENKLQKQRDTATFGEQTDAFVSNMFYNQVGGSLYTYLNFEERDASDFKPQKEWQEYISKDENALNFVKQNNMPLEYVGKIKESVSSAQASSMMQYDMFIRDRQDRINRNLSTTAQVVSGVTGALLDVDSLASGGFLALTKMIPKAGNVMATADLGVFATASAVRAVTDKDYSMTEGMIDATLGMFSASVIFSMRKPYNEKMVHDYKFNAVSDEETIDAVMNSNSKTYMKMKPEHQETQVETMIEHTMDDIHVSPTRTEREREVTFFQNKLDELKANSATKMEIDVAEKSLREAIRNRDDIKSAVHVGKLSTNVEYNANTLTKELENITSTLNSTTDLALSDKLKGAKIVIEDALMSQKRILESDGYQIASVSNNVGYNVSTLSSELKHLASKRLAERDASEIKKIDTAIEEVTVKLNKETEKLKVEFKKADELRISKEADRLKELEAQKPLSREELLKQEKKIEEHKLYQNIGSKIEKLKHAISSSVKSLKNSREVAQEVSYMMKSLSEVMDDIKSSVSFTNGGKTVIEQEFIRTVKDALKESGHLSKKDIDAIFKDAETTGKLKDSIFRIGKTEDGSFQIFNKQSGKLVTEVVDKDGSRTFKKLPTVMALALLGAMGANASEDEDNGGFLSNDLIFAVIAMLLIGGNYGKLAKAYREGAVRRSAIKLLNVKKVNESMSKQTKYRAVVNDTIERLNFTLVNGFKDITNSTIPLARELGAKLIGNPLDGRDYTVNWFQEHYNMRFSRTMMETFQKSFTEWAKAMEIKLPARALSLLATDVKHGEFATLVWKRLEGSQDMSKVPPEAMKHIDNVVNDVRGKLDELHNVSKESGMDLHKYIKNYVPRLYRPDFINKIKTMSMSDFDKTVEAFAPMFYKDKDQNVSKSVERAREYLTDIRNMEANDFTSMNNVEEIILGMKEEGKSAEEISEFAKKNGVKASRVKDRKRMDYKQFNGVKLSDGSELVLTDILDTDIRSLFSRYMHTMSGHIGFSKMGYKSVSEFDADIKKLKKEGGAKEAKKLENTRDLLLGNPLFDPTNPMTKSMLAVKNLTYAMTLGMSGFSLAPEILKTFWRGASSREGFRAFGEFISKHIKNDPEAEDLETLMDATGFGLSRYGNNTAIRGDNDLSGLENVMSDTLSTVTSKMKDTVIMISQLPKISDWISQINLNANGALLAKVIHGEKELTEFDSIKYGITPERVETLKDIVRLTAKGNLKKLNMHNWTEKQKDAWVHVMSRLQQGSSQESTLSGASLSFRDNPIGVALSGLLQFPMTAYANHGLHDARGVATGNLQAMVNTAIWVAGAYASTYARDLAKGKETDSDTALYYALMSTPMTGLTGVGSSLLQGGTAVSQMNRHADALTMMAQDGLKEAYQ